jgi:hypothetical protein
MATQTRRYTAVAADLEPRTTAGVDVQVLSHASREIGSPATTSNAA